MGIYFMAAGSSSNNRSKTLEKSFSIDELKYFLPQEISLKLQNYLKEESHIYLWGATKRKLSELNQVQPNEYVVDVKNRKIPYIFKYCFYYETYDTKLQEYVGWDAEKSRKNKRYYKYIYFLKSRIVRSTPQFLDHGVGFVSLCLCGMSVEF